MLVLTRSQNQAIRVGHEISVRILEVRGGQVRIGIEAPREISVDREEIYYLKHHSGDEFEAELSAVTRK